MPTKLSGKLSDSRVAGKLGAPTKVCGGTVLVGVVLTGKLTDTKLTGIMEYGIEVV